MKSRLNPLDYLFVLLIVLVPAWIFAAVPERIILTWTGDPATSQSVTWRSEEVPDRAVAEIVTVDASPAFAENARQLTATSQSVTVEADREVCYHTADFTGLTPNTLYAYRVGVEDSWSEWNQFRTASAGNEPFRFVYLGDAQNRVKAFCSRTFRAAMAKAPDALFFLHAGDLVNRGINDWEWDEWFQAGGWIMRTVSTVPVPGNHEYRNGQITPLWGAQFALPENGPEGMAEKTYFFDIQGLRVISLNGNEDLAAQAEWLERVLGDNPRPWTVVSMHQPIYSTGQDRDNPRHRAAFMPLFDRYGVDLVLQGHDHTYGRTFKLRGGEIVADDESGTVYVVSVAGPKMYDLNPRFKNLMAKMGEQTQLYQIVHVDGSRLRLESWTVADELFDVVELIK